MEDRPSMTAFGIAVNRAYESEKPEEERICYDPFAARFVKGWIYRLFRLFMVTGYAEMRSPGVQGFLAVRDRYIDDYLQSCIDRGLEQLIILGAGYDSRAYRFEALRKARVFEVDHPATQKAKIDKVVKVFGHLPGHVVFVPVDFTKESLEMRLFESGYDPKLRTLFIWQGVTYYITEQAIDSTLAFIRNHSCRGSSVIFDYTYDSVINGTYRHSEISSMKRYKFMTGEGMVFGIPEGKIGDFLGSRGFREIRNVTGDELKKRYFKGKNEARKVAPWYSIVSAEV